MIACVRWLSLTFSLVACLGAAVSFVCLNVYRHRAHKMADARYEVVRGASEWLAAEMERDPTAFSDDARMMITVLDATLDREMD